MLRSVWYLYVLIGMVVLCGFVGPESSVHLCVMLFYRLKCIVIYVFETERKSARWVSVLLYTRYKCRVIATICRKINLIVLKSHFLSKEWPNTIIATCVLAPTQIKNTPHTCFHHSHHSQHVLFVTLAGRRRTRTVIAQFLLVVAQWRARRCGRCLTHRIVRTVLVAEQRITHDRIVGAHTQQNDEHDKSD